MESENLSVEQRLAKLEAREDGNGRVFGILLVAAVVLYALWAGGVLKIDLSAAKAASA
jgi:hypothetical protein